MSSHPRARAGPAESDPATLCERADPGLARPDALARDRREHDQVRVVRARAFDLVERRVAAEVRDPPATRVQREPERDQTELVLLSGKAREQGDRPEAAPPPAREPQHPAANDARREMLLANRRLAAPPPRRPPRAETGAARRRAARLSSPPRGPGRSPPEPPARRAARSPRRARPAQRRPRTRERRTPPRPVLRDLSSRLGGGEPGGQVLLHEPDALEVVEGVEPQTAGRPNRVEEPVAPLPRAQQLRAHARALAQLTDPQPRVRHRACTVQHMNKTFDS